MASAHRFRLGPRLGAGAFGEVLRAYDRELNRWVALKRTTEGADLRGELEALSAVSHPNVVEAGVWVEGESWSGYTMALVEGPDARTWVRGAEVETAETRPRRNLPMAFGQPLRDVGDSAYALVGEVGLDRLRALLCDVASALEALHAAGWMHLDVSPTNLRATEAGVMLIDFGSARRVGADDARAQWATAAYGAPELGARPPTVASDWYSLGVVAFELLLGARPFEGGGPEVLVRKQSLEASAPRELHPGVPEDLDRVCVGLLRRSPGSRMRGPALRDHIMVRGPVR